MLSKLLLRFIAGTLLFSMVVGLAAQQQVGSQFKGSWVGRIEGWNGPGAATRYLSIDSVDSAGVVNGVWGFGPATPIPGAKLLLSGDVLQIAGGANSRIEIKRDGDRLAGNMILANGTTYPISFTRMISVLSAEQARTAVSGKQFKLTRLRDGASFQYELKADGGLAASGVNMISGATVRSNDSGTWNIRDDGALCLNWNGQTQSGCVFLSKNGDKLELRPGRAGAATSELSQ